MKLHKTDQKGFTLIELMIVIAIIGILAAIAIPNFISYRDKAFCSGAESDANNIAAQIADYFAIPTNVSLANVASTRTIAFPGNAPYTLSGLNTAIITVVAGPPMTFSIAVTDASTRCPANYQTAVQGWAGGAGAGVFTKAM